MTEARSGRMNPSASSEQIRRRMQRQHRHDAKPELALRRELWRHGLRYSVDIRVVGRRRRVNVAFTRARVAVFVDGCFWHHCPVHGTLPKSNRDWWIQKLNANTQHDHETDDELRAAGWVAIRVWEHEDLVSAADRVFRYGPAVRLKQLSVS